MNGSAPDCLDPWRSDLRRNFRGWGFRESRRYVGRCPITGLSVTGGIDVTKNTHAAATEPDMNILALRNGNSVRSIPLEALLNHYGAGRVTAWSASSYPAGRVYPQALALPVRDSSATAGLQSMSWDRFSRSDAAVMDIW